MFSASFRQTILFLYSYLLPSSREDKDISHFQASNGNLKSTATACYTFFRYIHYYDSHIKKPQKSMTWIFQFWPENRLSHAYA